MLKLLKFGVREGNEFNLSKLKFITRIDFEQNEEGDQDCQERRSWF